MVRVVSSQSEAEIERHRARGELAESLREIAANLLRIVNGGGRPRELSGQLNACSVAMRAYADAHGSFPRDREIRSILNPNAVWEERRPWIKERAQMLDAQWRADGTLIRELAIKEICSGALQMVASLLRHQASQHSRSTSVICRGARLLEESNQKHRAYWKLQTPKRRRVSPKGGPHPRDENG